MKVAEKSIGDLAFWENSLVIAADDLVIETKQKIRVLDFATQEIVRSYSDLHQDLVKAVAMLPGTQNTVISGGYDFKINIFDLNQTATGVQFNHGAPVEALCPFPNGFGFVSVGGYEVHICMRPKCGTCAPPSCFSRRRTRKR